MKDMNWWEKLVYTAIGWHYGCMQQPWILRMLLYPFGVLCIPFGAAFLPHYMCFPPGMPVPHFLQSNSPISPKNQHNTLQGNKTETEAPKEA